MPRFERHPLLLQLALAALVIWLSCIPFKATDGAARAATQSHTQLVLASLVAICAVVTQMNVLVHLAFALSVAVFVPRGRWAGCRCHPGRRSRRPTG